MPKKILLLEGSSIGERIIRQNELMCDHTTAK